MLKACAGAVALAVVAANVASCAYDPIIPRDLPPGSCPSPPSLAPTTPCFAHSESLRWTTFGGDRARTGWNAAERTLRPSNVASPDFGLLWSGAELDHVTIGGTSYAPHVYASPLYLDDVAVHGGPGDGRTLAIVIVATSNGYVYAMNAFPDCSASPPLAAGTILWRARLTTPVPVVMDGGVAVGILSTPVVDATSMRLYVSAHDAVAGWEVHALDVASGAPIDGWPVVVDATAVGAVDANGPSLFRDPRLTSQRGALNLGADGAYVYLGFAGYGDQVIGRIVAIDTKRAAVAAAFSGARSMQPGVNAGIWGAGGPAIDGDGRIYVTTGNSPDGSGPTPGTWGNSLLAFTPPLSLAGTYTPWNYCSLDTHDVDLSGASPLVLDFDAATTATSRLLAFGSKQGNIYVVDRGALPGALDARPPCGTDSSRDRSLLPPDVQPALGARGPLDVFGPYSENFDDANHAKMRSTPAFFRDVSGRAFLFVSGSTKSTVAATSDVPPSIAKLEIVRAAGAPAYLRIDAVDSQLAFLNPGAPVVSSNGADDAIVWVLDENAPRLASLLESCDSPRPVLYAIDATTLAPLYRSGSELHVGGKYNAPVVAHGVVFVATDRLQAFGLK
jgi:hypothetical protein